MAIRMNGEHPTLSEKEITDQINRELASLDKLNMFPHGTRFYFEEIVRARLSGMPRSVQAKLKQANERISQLIQDKNQRETLTNSALKIARADLGDLSDSRYE